MVLWCTLNLHYFFNQTKIYILDEAESCETFTIIMSYEMVAFYVSIYLHYCKKYIVHSKYFATPHSFYQHKWST